MTLKEKQIVNDSEIWEAIKDIRLQDELDVVVEKLTKKYNVGPRAIMNASRRGFKLYCMKLSLT